MTLPNAGSTCHGTAFPAAVAPDPTAALARQERLRELNLVTTTGIYTRLIIIAAEFLGVWFSHSSALFADAISSLFDVVSSLVLLMAIHFAAKPPDHAHPFGHGRVEPLAGFQLGLLLCATGIWLTIDNLWGIQNSSGSHIHSPWVWIIPGVATLMLWRIKIRIQRSSEETHSSALKAEGIHFQIDAITSLMTTITLVAALLLPAHAGLLDRIGAALLSLLMIGLGSHAAWENVHQLLDRVPHDDDFERVRNSATAVDGVKGVEKLQIQHAGPDAHVNIDIEVDPEISVAKSHLIAQHVRARIQSDWPFVRDVIVHVEPWYEGDH